MKTCFFHPTWIIITLDFCQQRKNKSFHNQGRIKNWVAENKFPKTSNSWGCQSNIWNNTIFFIWIAEVCQEKQKIYGNQLTKKIGNSFGNVKKRNLIKLYFHKRNKIWPPFLIYEKIRTKNGYFFFNKELRTLIHNLNKILSFLFDFEENLYFELIVYDILINKMVNNFYLD